MSRATVFSLLCIGAVVVGLPAGLVGEPLRVTEQMTGPWQLLIDDHVVSSKHSVVRRYHPFRKHKGNPLIVLDRPWEAHVVSATTVLPDESGTGFVMYYYCWTEKKPGKEDAGSYMCYATSKDGLTWEKPNLGLYEYEGSKDNNIIPNSPHAVMRTPWEADPQKRFQGVGDMYHAYSSPDGLHWKRESKETIVSGGDTNHFYWDPHTKMFRCTVKGCASSRVNGDLAGLRRRIVGFSETTDLTKFPGLRMVMAPDDYDDLWCKPGTVQRTHFYACPVLPYESMYVGFLQIYRAEEPEGFFHGPLWLELTSSHDGIRWMRQEPDPSVRHIYALYETSRTPLLDIGKFREFDEGMVIAPTPLRVNDELWFYYTGYDELHDLLPYHSAIGLAKLRKDGFASLDADECPGEILTKPFSGTGGVMQVNFDSRGGRLLVEVLDAEGRVIPGYGRDACEPLEGESIRQPVTWKTKKELPSEGTIRFRFLMEHVRLYSFMVGEQAKCVDEKGAAHLQALYTFDGKIDSWSDRLGDDGLQRLRNLGTCTIDHKEPDPATGIHSLVIGSPWRTWNRVEIEGTTQLGRQFTLAAIVKHKRSSLARLFSAYDGMSPIGSSDLIFEFDPGGKAIDSMRLFCKGVSVRSKPATFDDGKYHHLAVTYNDGVVNFYVDGRSIGEEWMPGGEPVSLSRNLLVGEDANRGSDEQLEGNVDDLLVYGRALTGDEVARLAKDGAASFFALHD